jgi:eukaryotic-like serine/threonine-protein kinase
MASSTVPPPDLAGLIIAGKYRIERLVGGGAMGSVWAARHATLGHSVAIKFIHPRLAEKAESARRFETEARAAAKLRSRHAVQVYDHGTTPDGQHYIVMEFLEGTSLDEAIWERGALPPAEVIEIIAQAAQALDVAHRAGVIHRDLKPENIMLATDPEAGRLGYTVKLVDFGIAKLLDDDVARSGMGTTHAGAVVGTPTYMSPEGLTGSAPVGTASDIWSLGACAYAAMVGRGPFNAETIGDVVLKVCVKPLPVPSQMNPKIPRGFDEWFEKACNRDPKQRFRTALELSQALRDLERMKQVAAEEAQYRIRPAEPSVHDLMALADPQPNSKVRLMAGVVLGASLTVGALGVFVWKRTDEANKAILEAAKGAAASVEAENERRLREAERLMLAAQVDAGVAPADAGPGSRARPGDSR